MNDENKLLPPRRTRITQSDVVVVPTLERLVDDALSVIGSELAYYRAKTKRGANLDLKEARALQGYVEALVKLTKEAREQSRAQDLSTLSNEELLQLASQLVQGKSQGKIDTEETE